LTDVTVLTPSLGYGRFIEDNILSVLGQEGLKVQHVVQDAGSTDETLAVLRSFDDAIDWVSEPDTGQSDALNKALAKAEGRWVAWLNADEFYLPGGLAALIRHGEDVSADLVYGDNVFVDGDGRIIRLLPQHRFSHQILSSGCFIASSSTVFRRSALPAAPWDTDFRRIMDWEFYLKLASQGARFAYTRYPVGAFRRHGEQVTAKPSREFWDEYSALFERYGISRTVRRRGLLLHRAHKLVNGSYWKERVAGRLQGEDLRWFRGEAGRSTFEALLRSCYGNRSVTLPPA
jgi:glycosyltransferase involved in cell wall biosynthesis